VLHFGVSGYSRTVGTQLAAAASATTPFEQGQLRPRALPENSIDSNRLIDTANLNFADSVQLVGVEAAGFHGPFGFQTEWAQMNVSQDRQDSLSRSRPDLTFSGAYVNANWFITGESRAYDPRTGLFTRVTPRAPLDPQGGSWGAFEIAARWSTLDLNSDENTFLTATHNAANLAGVRGGEETNYTLGLNWYWNAYFRWMLNYVHADVERASFVGTTTAQSRLDTTADLVSLRVQQEW
jgi:phosphate-selective porin OprO/OprP